MNQNTTWKRTFYIIYTGQAFSIIGSAAVQFAIIWYLTLQTESAITLSLAMLMGFIPGTLFAPLAGVLADRHDKKLIMILSDGIIALSSIILAVAFIMNNGTSPLWLIYVVLFIRGLGTVFHAITMQAAIPSFVPESELIKAGGFGQMINGIGNLAGPALGVVLVGILPMEYIMSVDVVGAIIAIVALLFVKIPRITASAMENETKGFVAELKAGIVSLKQNVPLLKTTPHYVLTGFLYMPLSALMLLIVYSYYGGTVFHAGVFEVSFATGMIVGSIVIGLFTNMRRKLTVFSVATILIGILTATIALLPLSLFWLAATLLFTMGVIVIFFTVPFNAFVQESVPQHEIGRVTGLIYTLCYIGNPLGLILAGPIADQIGVNVLYVCLGILLTLNGAICFFRIRTPEKQYLDQIQRVEKSDNSG